MASFFLKFRNKLHLRSRYRAIVDRGRLIWRIQNCRRRQKIILARIRSRPDGRKIRVLFLCNDVSKWKCQSVYRAMASAAEFDPMIGISAMGLQARLVGKDLETALVASEMFFDKLGDKHVRVVSKAPFRYDSLRQLAPDLVFFPEPWSQIEPQTTECLSQFALPCYVPYYVPTHIESRKHCLLEMHRFLTWYFILSQELAKEYRKELPFFSHAYRFIPVGHPALDEVSEIATNPPPENGFVIYAPHFSISFPEGALSTPISTFLETGIPILRWAQHHPEIKWAFKPHPKLRSYLVETGSWNQREVDSYWRAWEKLGETCYDGGYVDLFRKSRALITDCDSFLAEYGATGRPILHLVRVGFSRTYADYLQPIVSSYYTISNQEEMEGAFDTVLLGNEDERRERRLNALEKSGLLGNDAAQNIVDYLRKELRRQDGRIA